MKLQATLMSTYKLISLLTYVVIIPSPTYLRKLWIEVFSEVDCVDEVHNRMNYCEWLIDVNLIKY